MKFVSLITARVMSAQQIINEQSEWTDAWWNCEKIEIKDKKGEENYNKMQIQFWVEGEIKERSLLGKQIRN